MNGDKYKKYVLLSLLLVYIFNFVDRQILALLMEPIKDDLNLTDTQLGFMSGIAFAIFYTGLGIPIARLADRKNRVTIVSVAIAIWSGMTVLSGMAVNFTQLILARIGVGVGEAGCTPPAHSLISDYFQPEKRSKAIAVYMMGVPLGILSGFLLGGWINELYGWRVAFIALGAPGLVVAFIVKLTIKEPERGRYDAQNNDGLHQPIIQTFKRLWSISSYRYLVLAMSFTAFVGSGIGQWQAAFFIRNHGMTTGELGTWLAFMVGFSGAIGTYVGGYICQKYAANDIKKQLDIVMISVLLLAVPGVMSLLFDSQYLALVSVGCLNFLYFFHYGPCYAIVLNLSPTHMRAMASALTLLAVNLIGAGVGPQAIGFVSDLTEAHMGVESLRFAMLVSFLILIFSIIFFKCSKASMFNALDGANNANGVSSYRVGIDKCS